MLNSKPTVEAFFEKETSTLTYLVSDPATLDCVVIDPVMDYDPGASRLSAKSLEPVFRTIEAKRLSPRFVLETHAHADHVSGAQIVKQRYPNCQLAVGEKIAIVQQLFKPLFDLPPDFKTDGRQFDRLLKDGETFSAGSLSIHVFFTPGHTPACSSYLIGDACFTGDALFSPDYGTGRCDFPGGCATDLFRSVHERIYRLPDSTRIYSGHDYQPNGRPVQFGFLLEEQKRSNIHLRSETTEAQFVSFRNQRDQTLSAPKLLYPSVQLNISAGRLPSPHANQRRYLVIPLEVDKACAFLTEDHAANRNKSL